MNVLVTAGNTQVLIDRVRCLTNIFTGRTGARVALEAQRRGHTVTLLTSHPETVNPGPAERFTVRPYRTFEDLHDLMVSVISSGGLDAVIHSAAVSDFLGGGIYAPAVGTEFHPESGKWTAQTGAPALADASALKVKSHHPELWLRLVRAPKLVDLVRSTWGFRGVLVKFKLEVGIGETELLDIAEPSRAHSHADLMVANTLEGAAEWAYLGLIGGRYERVARADLERRLLDEVERLHQERSHG
jgi:phosphopantothenoylcysteine synthetase/decarboxylase